MLIWLFVDLLIWFLLIVSRKSVPSTVVNIQRRFGSGPKDVLEVVPKVFWK